MRKWVLIAALLASTAGCVTDNNASRDAANAQRKVAIDRDFNRQLDALRSQSQNMTEVAYWTRFRNLIASHYGESSDRAAFHSRIIADAELLDAGRITQDEFRARKDEGLAAVQRREAADQRDLMMIGLAMY
jgi:hypothetical protein